MSLSRLIRLARAALLPAAIALLVLGSLVPAAPVAAAGGPVMKARALLQGHVRAGSWFAIAVDLENAGPTVTGELRVTAGADARSVFGTPVELATGSRKEYLLYALPPAFGGNLNVELADGDRVVAKAQVAIALHDQTQLLVGIVSDNPAKLVGDIDLLPAQNGLQPVVAPLDPVDLPERPQAWAPLDRLVWQDVDAASLTPGQLSALRTWIAGGGRLVIVGGTAGADVLTGFPDDLLPYRPTSVLDIDPAVLRPVLGGVPDQATTLTAYAGDLVHGRALATSGDRVIAADQPYGSGSVTLLGFDPTTSWIAAGSTWDGPLWRRLLPPRSGGTVSLADDQMIVGAVTNLPSLALPPIGSLLVLLLGYIVLVGPVNYVVLRRLDRREWAWVTVPVLIVVFTAGSLGIATLLRGSDVIVNEVAIVHGAPGTDQALAQSYLGIFSPTRATFQVQVAGDALLATPMNGDMSGTSQSGLDVLEGDPSRVRNLEVGYGSMRTVRADASATAPAVSAALRLENGRIKGSITNASSLTLTSPAIVLGGSALKLPDIAPGATTDIDLPLSTNLVNQTNLSDRVVGSMPFDGGALDEATQRLFVRRSVIDQLSFDPVTGFSGSLPNDSVTLLAWGTDPVVPAEIEGARVRRMATVLYEIPLPLVIRGRTTFRDDLLRASPIEVNATWFNKDPWTISLGIGNVTMAYRPIAFDGTLSPELLVVAMTFGGDVTMPVGDPVTLEETTRCDPSTAGCTAPQDGLPDLEVLDVRTGTWVQFAHLNAGRTYELSDAARWVDPTSGEVQVKFVNERQDGIGFQFPMALTGTVR